MSKNSFRAISPKIGERAPIGYFCAIKEVSNSYMIKLRTK